MPKFKNPLSSIYCDKDWKKFKDQPMIPLGTVDKNEHKVIGLKVAYPNILVAGKSKKDKANFFHCAITNILRQNNPRPLLTPKNIELVLIGKKDSEFSMYENLSCLHFHPLSDWEDARDAVFWCISEMAKREALGLGVKMSFDEYNKQHKKKLPKVVVFIDDLAWVIKTHPKLAEGFELINKTSAWLGFYFVIGVSNPAKNKAIPKNVLERFFMRICFATSTVADSKAVVGNAGAEKLAKGNCLFNYAKSEDPPMQLQSYRIAKKEIKETVEILKGLEK